MCIRQDSKDLCFSIAELAVQSILYEVSAYPSPGLVSPVSQGSHKDMDYYTFIDSTVTLIKPLVLCAEAGYSSLSYKDIFKDIRRIGINGEKAMFNKTSGINTHKGMLFLMGIATAAVAKALYEKESFDNIKHIIKAMTEGLVDNELKNIPRDKALSHGEKLYIKYNISGIRGEVEQGIPIVMDYALDLYEKSETLPKRHRIIHSLIGIMQYCEDTTILHRNSIEVLNWVKERACHIMSLGGMFTEEGQATLEALDKEFIKKNISPGGSADLLSATIFLYEVKKRFFKEC